MFYMISTAVKSNVEINCLKKRRLWMLLANGGNILKKLHVQIEMISAQTNHEGRELATAWSPGRGSCLLNVICGDSKNVDNNGLERPPRHLNTKSKDFSRYSRALGLTLTRRLRGALAVWHLTRKTARMPDLATFPTPDSKVLLRLGEQLSEAYIKGGKIIEMYQIFLAHMVRHRPWRHNLPVA